MNQYLVGAMILSQGWLWPGLFYCYISHATGSWKLT